MQVQHPEFLTSAEVCARFRISTQSLTAWVRDGHLRAYKLGPRTYRYSASEIEAFVASTATDREVPA
jgi:excisionase family DNA binding protein